MAIRDPVNSAFSVFDIRRQFLAEVVSGVSVGQTGDGGVRSGVSDWGIRGGVAHGGHHCWASRVRQHLRVRLRTGEGGRH